MRTTLLISALLLASATQAQVHDLPSQTGSATPTFRGEPNTTFFGWTNGTWDGNEPDVVPAALNVDIVRSTPPIGSGHGPLLVQNNEPIDIVSSSNNIYTGASSVDLTLTIPTDGTVGASGFTTIIIQGTSIPPIPGLPPQASWQPGTLGVFSFGAINGVAPSYVVSDPNHGGNAAGETQWFAKWELPGNQASYSVDISGFLIDPNINIVSVNEMIVDTLFSTTGYAPDIALAPEPTMLAGSMLLATAMFRRRRVNQ